MAKPKESNIVATIQEILLEDMEPKSKAVVEILIDENRRLNRKLEKVEKELDSAYSQLDKTTSRY